MRVLGMDISKEGVACVEIESAFGRYEIRETLEVALDPDADLDANPPMMLAAEFLQQLPTEPDRIITALPADQTTFRNMQVATRDKKAIAAALEFELEDDLPFESDDLHYDSAILESGSNGAMIHIGATKKERVATYLGGLNNVGVDPDILTTDAWAYRCLFSRIKGLPESVLLIGFERYKTFFYVHSGNRPVLYRELPFGTHSLERKLQENLGANRSELNNWIQDIGVGGIDEGVSSMIRASLEALVPELRQLELMTRGLMRSPYEQVFVTGSGALMPGLMPWFEEVLNRPVSLFRPLSMVSPSQLSYSDTTEIRFARALALALVNLPADKISPLNFRKRQFARLNENQNSPLELIKKPLPYLVTTIAVFFLVKSVEYKYYSSKLSDIDDSLKRSVKGYLSNNGTVTDNTIRTQMANIPKLKASIEKDLAKERELSKLYNPNANSPLEFLKQVSQKVGRDIVADLVAFDMGSDYTDKFVDNKAIKATLTFTVTNPQVLAKLTDVFEKTFNFRKGDSEEIKVEGHPAYRITYSGTVGTGK